MSENPGVIVARFQVADLHEGHRHLIDTVKARCGKVLVVLGEHGGMRTDRDPLTYDERADMVRESYPDVEIDRLRDHPFDHMRWSDWLDGVVQGHFPNQKVHMAASRDGFLSLYTGKHDKWSIPAISMVSGKEHRESITYSSAMSARAAIIHHEMKRHAIAYSAADIAIVDDANERLLAITKHWFDGLWSLVGGFVDPQKDANDLETAHREREEEVKGIAVSNAFQKVGDERIRVDDPRYRGSKDKIYSTLYATQYLGGVPAPADDAKGARWMSRSDLDRLIVPWHRPQVELIKARWDAIRNDQLRMAKA